MKKSNIILVIVLLFATVIQGQFRETKWGISQKEVKKIESNLKEVGTTSKSIFFSDRLLNMDVYVVYSFTHSDKLHSGSYVFLDKHSQKNSYIDDYSKVQEALTRKYEEPETKEVNWIDDLYRDDPSDYGRAVSIGHLNFLSIWETPTEKIKLVCSGDNYKINVLLTYISKKLLNEKEKERSKSELEKL